MGLIQLTQIQPDTHSCTGIESEIIGKIAIPTKLLENALIMENKELAPPKGFYHQNQIDYEISTSDILFNSPIGKGGPISVAESFETILKKLENKHHILLHELAYFEAGKYKLKTFSLDLNHVTHTEEKLSASYFSIDEIVDEDKPKLDPSTLGEYYTCIRTDLLDKDGNPAIFYAVESVAYIHSKM